MTPSDKAGHPVDIIRRVAVVDSLLFTDHTAMSMTFQNDVSNLHWVTHAAMLAEPEVAKKGAVILSKLKQDMDAFQEYQGTILDELHESLMKGDPKVGEISKHGREVFTALEVRMDERAREVEGLLSEAMRLSGTKVEVPAHLIRPRRWKSVVEMLERFASGYERERLEK